MEHVVIIEKAPDGSCSAHSPDLPGCVSCGDTVDEARPMIAEAVRLHVESLRQHREPVPPPTTIADKVVAA